MGGGFDPIPTGLESVKQNNMENGVHPKLLVSARCTATGHTKATTANGPRNCEQNFLVPARGKFLLESITWSQTAY